MEVYLGYEYEDGMHEAPIELNGQEELAQFICQNQKDKVVTDLFDNLVLNTIGSFIDTCPDQEFLREFLKILIPIQQGEGKE